MKLPLLLVLLLLLLPAIPGLCQPSLRCMSSGDQVHSITSPTPQKLSLEFRCFFSLTSSWTESRFVLIHTKINIALYLISLTSEIKFTVLNFGRENVFLIVS